MKKLTYKEAESMIFDAYFKDEIEPYNGEFCFCGTLSDNNSHWRFEGTKDYTVPQLRDMEQALLITIKDGTIGGSNIFFPMGDDREKVKSHPNYEEALFQGMCNALEILKQIHEERGEDLEDNIPLKKRVLMPL